MKRIVFIALCLLALSVKAQEINWVSIEKAVELQQKEPRKIIMDFYTKWCGPCKLLDRNTFKNKDVATYVNENFYAVKFNAEGKDEVNFNGKTFSNPSYDPARANRRNSAHEFTRYMQVSGYPSIVFIDEDQNLLTKVVGYQSPQQLELYLKLFKNNDHKSITSRKEFESYVKDFQAEFN